MKEMSPLAPGEETDSKPKSFRYLIDERRTLVEKRRTILSDEQGKVKGKRSIHILLSI